MPGFNLDDYEPVADRIERFWKDHPEGKVITCLEHRDEKSFIVKAAIYRERLDEYAAATGWAEEIIGSSNVNRTSALENCETSAIGRALANLGYAVKNRASREEMAKAQPEPRPRSGPQRRTPSVDDAATAYVEATVQALQSPTNAPRGDGNGVQGTGINKIKAELLTRLGGDQSAARKVWQAALLNFGLVDGEIPEDMVEALETYLKGIGTPV